MTENLPVRRRRVVTSGDAKATASELARELARESDLLSAAFATAAAAIATLQLGVSGTVEIARQQDPSESNAIVWSLRFAKVGDEWCLRIEKWNTDDEPWDADAMEPARAPRWIRERAAKVLPALVDNLEQNAKDELERVRAARTEIEGFAAMIANGGAS